jgi:DNA-binding response OmpR family regulator
MSCRVVLLVEDEALILLDIEAALVEEGFQVVTAIDGSKAVEAFEADPSRFDAVVTDINLGKGPNGWDLARQIRQQKPGLPIVYMTGDSAHEWEAMGVPKSVLIPKPFVHAQIITALATLMSHSSQA